MTLLAAIALLFALIPTALFLRNLTLYQPLPTQHSVLSNQHSNLSILIPARNEEHSIAAAIESILATPYPNVELLILNDHSTDRTAAIVQQFTTKHPNVHLHHAPPLPSGWNGKQHACHLLSTLAAGDLLLFLDADVRLTPDALPRLITAMQSTPAALLSGFPRQLTKSPVEILLLPLMHFLLLAFLPLSRMRNSTSPAYAAGCGQLFLARADAYRVAGGHAAIRSSLHDGITLPRAFRKHHLPTDLFDATDLASCRMYRSASEVWKGLSKNATEGLAAPRLILPATLLLTLGQLLPFALLFLANPRSLPFALAATAAILTLLPRLLAARRFRQLLLGALLHPLAILLLLAIQWTALLRHLLRIPPTWKDRPCHT